MKAYVKTDEAIAIAREVFSSEPVISRVEAHLLTVRDETNYVDLRIFVDGNRDEANEQVFSLVMRFMDQVADVPVEFLTLPSSRAEESSSNTLIYCRS